MVNVPNIDRVIASIKGEVPETASLGFNMHSYVYPTCGVLVDRSGRDCAWVGCIAGHAFMLSSGFDLEEAMGEDCDYVEEVAMDFLGLDPGNAPTLFYDLPAGIALSEITQETAISVLERLKETGQVRWPEEPRDVAA